MRQTTITKSIPVGLAVLGVVLLYVWLSADAAIDLTERVPPAQDTAQVLPDDEDVVKIQGELVQLDGVPADLPGAWPRFRGSNFDAVSIEDFSPTRTWPVGGPAVLWSIEVGEGYAGASILAGRVYIMDYDRQNQADVIRCLSLDDGQDIWRYSYPVKVKRWHGMSRTVPAVTEKYVVTMGPKCHVTCLDSVSGEFRWMFNLVKEFNTKVPQWYTAQCPLIDEGKAIIAPAGDILMMAIDCETGRILWQTPNPDGWIMTHSSMVPMEFSGKRFYVYCGGDHIRGGVIGVSAEDGSVLWKTDQWKVRFNVPMPVVIGPNRVFLTAGYGQTENGCAMLRLTEADGEITVESEFLHPTEVFGSIQHSPIFYNDHIYGVRPDGQLACLNLEGNVIWTSTSANKFGSGPYSIVSGLIYVMNDTGELTLVQANPSSYVELARAKVLDGHESWGPMAIASGRLIVRDTERMLCLDISQP
ncbi:MAG: PQQ-like beta-propeller repeat protein [Phycisphaerales bacterium]|nr:MAG: PQQ-like beta-propeller repeat protein [Phycisphaerales bacterium]